MKEPIVSFKYVMKNIKKSKIILQKRPKKYKFGTLNYGEIIGMVNSSDSDRWDIFAPGYTRELPINKEYKVKDVIGYFKLDDNNHKIAIKLYVPGFNTLNVSKEIKNYCKSYSEYTKINGEFIYF